MIKVKMYQDENGKYTGFHLCGHAGYAEYGSDIVCAAVSALVINTMNSIEQLTQDTFEGKMDEENGDIQFKICSDVSPSSQLLFESLVLGITGIKEQYGEEFIRFEK